MDREAFILQLTDQVRAMDLTEPNFDASAWVRGWIAQPVPALGGRRPEEFIGSDEGQREIATLLARAQSGAYS